MAEALFGASGAVTPLMRSASGLVRTAAESTPDLDISAVAIPYRQVRPIAP